MLPGYAMRRVDPSIMSGHNLFLGGIMPYDHDLTEEEVIEVLELSNIQKNSQSFIEYEYAKSQLRHQWTDLVARVVAEWVGV